MAYKMKMICFQNFFGTIEKNGMLLVGFFDKFSKVVERIH